MKRSAQGSLRVYDGSGRDANEDDVSAVAEGGEEDVAAVIAELEEEMTSASARLEFERAALLRDQILALKSGDYKKATRAPVDAKSGAKGKRATAYPKAARGGWRK